VAIDPKDLGELQKALNEAAGKASVLWTTFITFQLYLAIAFGSVTHRDLFLENSIKLPLLNVDLALVGFFVVAPLLLLIFHFYLFLQLLGLASKAKDYNTLLVDQAPAASDRRYLRQRLDVFPILQFLAGPSDQRTGFRGYSLRLMAWITLVATPLLILLQGQVTFLPYHREWIVWLQRFAVLIDLALIWYFWINLRSDDDPIKGVLRNAWMYLGGAGTLGASLSAAQMQGASLDLAELQGANLYVAQLQGASLAHAELQGASLVRAQLQGASLDWAGLQGAHLLDAQLQGARLKNVWAWRAFGTPNLYLADFRIFPREEPWEDSEFGGFRDAIANRVPAGPDRDDVIKRLAVLDPTRKKEPEDLDRAHSSPPQGEEFWGKRAMFLADLEHVPPQLNQGDSRGAEDGRGYRH
jgi:Pentapeptide repeats (8 copies)